ncbi:rhamnogalacturonan acetylesterase [Bremerella cremea]|uniref:rhamnogalacturonan acetylesterase n=1 Tax=Bremerella cremea TaxID=1031537 RepID=UPI0031E626D1
MPRMPQLAALVAAAFLTTSSLLLAADKPAKPKIILAGDSTVTDGAGWGVGFANSLNENATCINLAMGGRSSKSFRDEGRWKNVISAEPTYVLIQFGHNDQPGKGPKRETDPKTTFRENMARYVDEAKAAGAQPILVTSVSRRFWDADGKRIESILGGYAEGTRSVAKEKDVPLIDLHKISIRVYEELGREACMKMQPPGPNGKEDITHFNAIGSQLFGTLVAAELAKVLPETKPLIRDDLPSEAEAIEIYRQAK